MDQKRNVAVGDQHKSPIAVVTIDGEGEFNSIGKAARALALARHGKLPPVEAPEADGAETKAPPKSGNAAAQADGSTDDAPADGDPNLEDEDQSDDPEGGETTAEELPPIAPPPSWPKDDQELFASMPRAMQERLAEHERSRESDLLRHESESAERLKGLAAREQAMDAARQQYEAALLINLQLVQAQGADEFADIKTQADIEKMAKEDMPRYVKWNEHQRQLNVIVEQVRTAEAHAARDARQKWSEFAARQDALLIDRVPEMADRAKAAKMQDAAAAMLKDIGFSDDDLGRMWSGQWPLFLRDHRVQLLVLDGVRYREAQQKAKQAVAKPVPPVQRPGVSRPHGAAATAQIDALNKRLDESGSLKDAAALIAARRQAAR